MKKTIAVNPYLPFRETIPDAEPHVLMICIPLFQNR